MMGKSLTKYLVENHIQITAFAFILYFVSSIYSASQVIKSGNSVDPANQYVFISFVAVFFGAAWILLAKAAAKTYGYAKSIKRSAEHKAFLSLSRAFTFLTLSLMLTAYLNVFRVPSINNGYGKLTVLIYLFSALLSVTYFYFLGNAGELLAKRVKRRTKYLTGLVISAVTIGTTGVLAWGQIISSSQINNNPNHILNYLPDWPVFIVLYLPLVTLWSYGLAGAFGIYLYQRHVKGSIYKSFLLSLTTGVLLLVVVSSVRHISDYLLGSTSQTTLPEQFGRVLLLFTILLTAIICITSGVTKLAKIEDS